MNIIYFIIILYNNYFITIFNYDILFIKKLIFILYKYNNVSI